MATKQTATEFVKFLETRKVKAVNGPTYEKGRIYELSRDSANRWRSRGLVEASNEAEFRDQARADAERTRAKREAERSKASATKPATPAPGAPDPNAPPPGGDGSQGNA